MDNDESMVEYVKDRPGHDYRYSTDISKVKNEFQWSLRYSLDSGLEQTVEWYLKNYHDFD